MTNPKPAKKLSLGKLRPHKKTKDRSPDGTGKLHIRRELLLDLYKQMNQSDEDEVVADMAGWFNKDEFGKYITIQLSSHQRAQPEDCGKFFDFR